LQKVEDQQALLKKYVAGLKRQVDSLTERCQNLPEAQQLNLLIPFLIKYANMPSFGAQALRPK